MAEKKKFPISIGFNLYDVKRDLDETKEILKEKEKLESSGALPKSITSKQDKNKNQRSQQQGGRGLHKDTKSKSHTSGIVPENIIAQQQSQIRELQQKQKESEKKQKEYSKEQVQIRKDEKKERNEEYKKFNDKIKSQKEHDKLVDRQVNEMQETMLNPFFALRKRGAQALKAIIPLALVAEVSEMVLTRIQKEFGPGGRLDLRKLVLNIVTEFLQIPQRIQRDRGEVFFSSGYNSPLYQGAPGISNTERLVDGHLRDILIDPGR